MSHPSYPAQAAAAIRQRLPIGHNFVPKIGLVLGSGLGRLVQALTEQTVIPYELLPGFPTLSVKGHTGQMTLGYLNGVPAVCLEGRAHPYEGRTDQSIKTYVRTLQALGCELFFATNAAGSLREEVAPGSLVAISDHINFQFSNPLVGPNNDEYGPRFPALDNCYDKELREKLHCSADQLGVTLYDGVFLAVLGPSYETAAEIRAFKILGADLVGMSTVPEIIVARHCGMRSVAISMVTNFATGLATESHDHDAVIAKANSSADQLIKLIHHFAGNL
jgi:xanthosine phosphorylase